MREVAGSNPVVPTIFRAFNRERLKALLLVAAVVQNAAASKNGLLFELSGAIVENADTNFSRRADEQSIGRKGNEAPAALT